jgi:hypothetical protein
VEAWIRRSLFLPSHSTVILNGVNRPRTIAASNPDQVGQAAAQAVSGYGNVGGKEAEVTSWAVTVEMARSVAERVRTEAMLIR